MKNGYTVVELLVAIVGLFLGLGWLINISKIFDASWDVITVELVLRFIGIIVVPFGGIMGWM